MNNGNYNKKIFIALIVLCLLVVALIIISYKRSEDTNRRLQETIEKIDSIQSSNIRQPKDGYTPIKGVDYKDGEDGDSIPGANGKDSKSTHTIETKNQVSSVVKEKAIPGVSAYQSWLNLGNTGSEADFIASLKGSSAPGLETRTNPKNGNIEIRTIGETSWKILILKCTITGVCL